MPWPPRFLFTSGRLSIDFSQAGGTGRYAKFECLHTPSDLADWLRESSLGLRIAPPTAKDLAGAKRLRSALWTAAHAIAHDASPTPASLETIQAYASRPDLVPVLRDQRLAWRRGSTAQQALATIARDAIALFGSDTRTRLRACRNPACPLLFVDTSRPNKRAWCTMRRCGNLQKTKRYRTKRKRTNR